MTKLLDLPHEVLHSIFVHVDPSDTAYLALTCRSFHKFLAADALLHKELYLVHLDDPQYALGQLPPQILKERLHNLVRIGKSLDSPDTRPLDDVHEIASMVDYLLATATGAPQGSSTSAHRRYKNLTWLEERFNNHLQKRRLLASSSLYQWGSALTWPGRATSESAADEEHIPHQGTGGEDVEIVQSTGAETHEHMPEQELDVEDNNSDTEEDEVESESHYRIGLEQLEAVLMKQHDGLSPWQDSHESMRQGSEEPGQSTESPAPPPPTFFNTKTPQETDPSQLAAKLHCLYGVPIQTLHRNANVSHLSSARYSLRSDHPKIHPFARSRVYDLRQHTDSTLWGPFKPNSTDRVVDWEKLEAIMLLIDHNLKAYSSATDLCLARYLPDWTTPFNGAHPYSYTPRQRHNPLPLEPPLPLEARDPYNVTGTWMRVICFLDYTELYDFNFSTMAQANQGTRPPLDTEEAIRMIEMKIFVTKIEEPGEEDGPELPVVWFRGDSRAVGNNWDPNARSKIRGCVRLTKEGEVHWTTWSVFYGEERWRSEGIQIGGVQSGRGVFGFWFDKDYDAHGPAGPSAFWKLRDGVESREGNRRTPEHERRAFHMPLY